MAFIETLMRLSYLAMLIELTMAANYIVGGSNGGWDTSTNLQPWASSQTFTIGDNLIFQYTPNHDVAEVTKADYDSCLPSNPIQTYNDGASTIPLSSPGKRYFICGTMGHCSQGMKVEIDTLAASASQPIASSSAPTPSPVMASVPSPAPEPTTFSPTPSSEDVPAVPTPSPEDVPAVATPSPEDVPAVATPSPIETRLNGPTLSPVVPSTEFPTSLSPAESSPDPSAASAKLKLQASFAIGFNFLVMLLAP
ncbi:Blue copper protein [Quillaja saponaria]|uniref:Blue copper protein n=1 Tax=Quillaja saponaria TaxID=32244 RepID=A0AAD7PAY9_QUISA|nr:Blue copper protein [Quillaja saponaria]